MKNSIFLLVTLLFFSSFYLNAQWVQTSNGITGGNILTFTANGNNLFAGGNTVYLSSNNGSSWTNLNQGGAILASNSNYVFVGAYGIYRSSDNGTTWSFSGLANRCFYSLAANGNLVYAGLHICAQANTEALYVSTDNGTSWTQKPVIYLVRSIAVSGNNVYAGTTGGVYRSTDNGITWSVSGLNYPLYSVAANNNNVFAGTYFNGVYKSTDYGVTWNQTSLTIQHIYSLAISGNNIFAGTYQNGFYVSNDNGTSWTQRNEGLPNAPINALIILNNYVFAGTNGYNVYRRSLNELVGIRQLSNEIPKSYSLLQNYPNPFNPSTKIKFEIPPNGVLGTISKSETNPKTEIRIYDILGREVATLVNEELKPGTYEVEWNASNYPSGVYYYKLISGDFSNTKKMVLIK